MSIKNYPEFKKIQEVRRTKKCPVLSFKPIRESEAYKDMTAMGWTEMIAENPIGIETQGTEEQRYFKDRLGNIAFKHDSMKSDKPGYPQFNIKHDGGVRVVYGPSKAVEFPRLNTNLRRACMTVEDYLFKMGFLIKYILREQGVPMSEEELLGNENYKDVVRRKMEENPEIVKNFEIPPSLKGEDLGKGANILKRFGGFDD
jgi:hypothetical protein